jgi:NADH-quinone oxidoreductase subunit J
MIPSIFFYLFSAVLIGCAVSVVTARNPVHAVLFLILAFINAAGLFVLAGAEFLAMILVIVYVGAVAGLFLFVVMMREVDFNQLREGFQRYLGIGLAVGAILVGELLSVLIGWQSSTVSASLRQTPTPGDIDNTHALGQVIYTDYALLFQVAGLILLVAMIGAIVLTHRERTGTRRQNITRQQTREVADTLEVLRVELGATMQQTGYYRPKVTAAPAPAEVSHGPHDSHYADVAQRTPGSGEH